MPHAAGIELRHLRYFLAVYEELHFGRAAERLSIAQPPLSQAIQKLEHALGVQLFVRSSRAVEPTPAAAALAEEARRVLAGFEFAILETQRVASANAPLRVGWASLLPAWLLHRFIAALKQRDAFLRVEVAHLWTLEQVERLRAGSLDVGVLVQTDEFPDLEHELLFPGDEIYVFLPRDHELAAKDVVTPPDLASETQLTFPRAINPTFYDHFMQLFAEAGYRFRAVRELDTSDPRDGLLAVANGLGVAFGPKSYPEVVEEGRLVIGRPLALSFHFPDAVVAWRATAPRRLRSLLTAVREAARELRELGREAA